MPSSSAARILTILTKLLAMLGATMAMAIMAWLNLVQIQVIGFPRVASQDELVGQNYVPGENNVSSVELRRKSMEASSHLRFY